MRIHDETAWEERDSERGYAAPNLEMKASWWANTSALPLFFGICSLSFGTEPRFNAMPMSSSPSDQLFTSGLLSRTRTPSTSKALMTVYRSSQWIGQRMGGGDATGSEASLKYEIGVCLKRERSWCRMKRRSKKRVEGLADILNVDVDVRNVNT